MFTNILTHECTLDHQNISVCEVSDTYLLGCLRYTEKHRKDILISCGCVLLFTNKCKHGGGLVLGKSLIVVRSTGVLLSQSTVVLCI